MNTLQLNNLKIFNLVEKGHSTRTLQRIFDFCNNSKIEDTTIINAIGNTPTSKSIIEDLPLMKEYYYSVYCLTNYDVNIFIIEKLKEFYTSLNDLALDFENLNNNIKLQVTTIAKIKKALIELNLFLDFDLQQEILHIIMENEPVSDSILKEKMLNKYQNLSIFEYDKKIDLLISKNIIINTFDGLKIKKLTIEDFFNNISEKIDFMVKEKCQGDTYEKIASKYFITKQRVQQIIKKKINVYPIFENEIKYKNLLSIYELSQSELELIGINDKILIEYIYLKYNIKPKKTALDYINDLNLFNTTLGNTLLKNKNLVIINNEIIDLDFVSLFKCYIKDKNINSFVLDEVIEDYNKFIGSFNIFETNLVLNKGDEELKAKARKLARNKSFIEIYNKYFLIYREDLLSFEFVDAMRKYLNEFNGYGAVTLFFKNNEELCVKNGISNDLELFALMKRLFSKEYKEKIIFVRNPVIVSRGVDKKRFIENLILDMDLPCTVNDYLSYVNAVTGLKEKTVLGNFSEIINQFKNSNGYITLDDELTNDDYNKLFECINHECIGFNHLKEKLEIKFDFNYEKVDLLLNSNNLKKIGFVKTNTSIYSDKFSNRLDAVRAELLSADFIIIDSDLAKISNKEYFYYKTFDSIDECYVVKISEHKYLNLLKRQQCDIAKKLKIDIEKSINFDGIYLLDDYVISAKFKNILNSNEEYRDLLYSFNPEVMLSFFLSTIRSISCLNTSGTLIFSKQDLSMKKIIDVIMNDYETLTILELREQLYDQFKIKSDISNGTLSEMGYYCPSSSEKVYLNKEYYEKEMEELLNGNS